MIKKRDSTKNIVEVIKKFKINKHRKAIGNFIINLIIVLVAAATLFGLIWAIMSGSL